MTNRICRSHYFGFLLALWAILAPSAMKASGTWTALNSGPPVGVNNCLLLSDGTVLGMNGAGQCVRLTPDIHGSYINGTWTTLTTMNSARLFFSSDLLTNGNVFVAGGEYGDANHYDAELYDSRANTWTVVPGSQAPNFNYSDSPSEMLPNGNILESDSQSSYYFYNVASNMMIYGGTCGDMNEVCWVKLANGGIFGVDNYGDSAEHFAPLANEWIQDASSTPSGAQAGDDQEFLLPNGQVFHVGSTTNTAFYTPGATVTSAGTLVNGPNLPIVGTNQLYGGESPGAVLDNGNILLDLAPNGGGANGGSPCYFYEYNYLAKTFTQVSAPGGGSTYNSTPFANSMLVLPDGSVLYVGGQNSGSLYIYTPVNETPLGAGQPVINSITENTNGSYHLTGVGLNGISEGAMYGDDEQMAGNYPLVRLTNNASGNIYYARTYGWNSTTVQNPNTVTTEFTLPPNLPPGTYSLVVSAVGNASVPVSFTYSPPPAPAGLAGTAGNAEAILSWNVVAGATAYNLKQLTPGIPPYYATVVTIAGTSYTNSGLVNALSYFYEVSAVGPGGESTNSSPVLVTPAGPPPIPVGVTATPDTFARIDLSWTPSYEATNYLIQRATTHGGPYAYVAGSANPFYTDTGLIGGITYYYVIAAQNAQGQSLNSAEVNATAQAVGDLGFEIPSVGSGNYVYVPAGSSWTFSGTNGNGSGIVANGSGFSNPNAPEGVQAALIQSNGVISQVLSGFVPGNTYTILYSAAQRGGDNEHGGESWNVMIDGTVIQSNSPGSTSYADYTATFVATATMHTLSFVGTDLAGGDNTVFIDDVRVGVLLATVANPGFETPVIGTYEYSPSGGSWTFSGSSPSGSGLIANGSAFSNPNAPQGAQAAFVQEHGTVVQTISGLTPGATYSVNYDAAERPANSQSWNVKIGSTVIQSNSPGSTSYADYTAPFVATGTSQILSFVGTDLIGGDNTIFLDDVNILSPIQPVAPAITLTSPVNGTTFTVPASVNLAASVVTNGNLISSVQFYDNNSNLIGQATSPPYSYTWSNPNNGLYNVYAAVAYADGSVLNSADFRITVVNYNQNLGFELPSVGSGNFQYNPVGGSWVFSGASPNGSGIVGNGSGFSNPNAPQGVQAAFVQELGAISQALTGFIPGVSYSISFSAAQRSGVSQHGGESWNVMIDGSVITNYNPGSISYTTCTAYFIASVPIHTLSFVGTDWAGGDNTVFIDNVIITPVAPPVPAGLNAAPGNAQVTLAWNASSGATGYNLERSTASGGPYTLIASLAGTNDTDNSVTNSTTYYYIVSATNIAGPSAYSLPVSATPVAPLPPFWLTVDIGNVGVMGNASYSSSIFTVNGSGNAISNSADAFRYVYQLVTNNFTATVEVMSESDTGPWAEAGIMARETTNSDSTYFAAYVTPTPSQGVSVQYRPVTGGNTMDLADLNGPSAPYWVRIVRNNNTFTAYSSADGITWTKTGPSQNISMATNICVGLPVCANNNSLLCTATFGNVMDTSLPVTDTPPVLSGMETNGQFSLQFQGAYDLNYTVETSTNLVDWTSIYTNALDDTGNGVFIFIDTNNLPLNFYRISQ